jgi:hypothetical protein
MQIKMDSEFRHLNERERELLAKLLSVEFPGRDELRTQLTSLTGKQIKEDGTLKFRCDSGSPSSSRYRLAMEGTTKDADGGTISVMLHIDNAGFMHMLEIVKYGDSPIITPPSAPDLVLLLPEDGGSKPEKAR